MDVAKPLCRLAIFSTIYLAASVCPSLAIAAGALSTVDGREWLTEVSKAIASVAGGNTANAIDDFLLSAGNDYVPLQNEDLIRVSGKVIAKIIAIESENKAYDKPSRDHLKKVASKTTENWVKLARSEFSRHKYDELNEGQLPQVITPTEEGLTQAKILTPEEWRTIFAKLDLMAVPSDRGVDLSDFVRQQVAESLHHKFPMVLREALKQNFKEDGTAFAELTIQLLTEIRKEICVNQRQTRKNRKTTLNVLKDIHQIKKQLAGDREQIKTTFFNISEQIDSGFSDLCQQLGIIETNINKTLYALQESVDEISGKTTAIKQDTSEIKVTVSEICNLLNPQFDEPRESKLYKALLKLDYTKQEHLFEEFIFNYQIGACLVHGVPVSSPRWLLNRLIQQVPNGNTSNFVKRIRFSGSTKTCSPNNIFQEMSRCLRIDLKSSIPAIAQKICQLWQSQTVILIFENTHIIEESELEHFLQKFWYPLVDLALKTEPKSKNYRLLLFLLDLEGYTNNWEITCTQTITSEWTPHTPIKLQEIKPILPIELSCWLEQHLGITNLLDFTETLVQEIYESSQGGIHQYILEEICYRCNVEWEDHRSTWLKY